MTEKYFFVHLQKTGGSSLKMQLRHLFGERGVYPSPFDGDPINAVISPEHLLECYQSRGDEISVIAGHLPLATTELLPAEFKTFSLLREPVERTLSFLRHQIKTSETPSDDPEILYGDSLRMRMTQNHMTKMMGLDAQQTLSGGAILAEVEMNEALLQRACERLATLDVLGVQERHDEFVDSLERTFGWDLGPRKSINRTEEVPVSQAFKERIAQDNALDVALYEYALELLAKRSNQTD